MRTNAPKKGRFFKGTKANAHITVRKFQDFSAIPILREINFGQCRSSKTAIFAILQFLILLFNWVKLSLQKVQKIHEIQNLGALILFN